jgi:hypothetical protein
LHSFDSLHPLVRTGTTRDLASTIAFPLSPATLLEDPFHLLPIGQIGGDAVGLAVLGPRSDGVIDLAGVPRR